MIGRRKVKKYSPSSFDFSGRLVNTPVFDVALPFVALIEAKQKIKSGS